MRRSLQWPALAKRRPIVARALSLLLAGTLSSLSAGQEPEGLPVSALFGGQAETLRLDLHHQTKATLQARSDWLAAEKQLLELEITRWRESAAKLKTEFDKTHACDFDLEARACKPGKDTP